MSRNPRILVIWNPSAGGGKPEDADDERARIHDALAEHGLEAEIYRSTSEADANARIDRGLEEGFRAIVAAGGDGTVRSVAARMVGREVPLGILPVGTAMNAMHSLGLPLDLEAAAAVLASGEVRPMDVGVARDHVFLGVLSVGLGAEVLGGAERAAKGRLGMVAGLLRRTWRYRRTRVCVRLDGREIRTRAESIVVANGRFTGRRLELARDARLDDGQFDVLVFEGLGGSQLLLHLARALFSRGAHPRVRRYRAAVVGVSTHRPLAIRADAVDLGVTPVEIVCRGGALRVLAPP